MMPSTGSKKNVMNPTMKEVLNPVHLLIPEEVKRNRQINYQTKFRVNYLEVLCYCIEFVISICHAFNIQGKIFEGV